MKISGSGQLFSWTVPKDRALGKAQKNTLAETLSQMTDQAVKVTISKEGLESLRKQSSGKGTPEDIEKLKEEMTPMEELPSYCHSLNFGIGLGGSLQEIGEKYAQKYDEIVKNHGKGKRVVIKDEQTGDLRDATLEEKLAVLDKSFEKAMEMSNLAQQQRPVFIKILESQSAFYRKIGALDLADETEYKLEQLKNSPKLPEDFQKHMIKIREEFKAAYSLTGKDQAWEAMINSINKLFE